MEYLTYNKARIKNQIPIRTNTLSLIKNIKFGINPMFHVKLRVDYYI